MVDVPDYLLERSRQRRAELTGAEPEGGDAAPEAATPVAPAVAAAASPAPAAPAPIGEAAPPPPPEPDPPYVQAAHERKRMPYWAAAVMVFLPLWAIFYVGMLEPPDTDELVLADNGAIAYSTCASCHGADGSGSATGRQLNDGELLLTFGLAPDFDGLAHHLSWVYLGTAGTKRLGLDFYGNPDRPGGQREVDSFANGMSGFSNLSLEDLVSVVYYERVVHGGLDAEKAAHTEEMLLALVSDAPTFETGSPDEISALLTEAAEGHGIDLAAGE